MYTMLAEHVLPVACKQRLHSAQDLPRLHTDDSLVQGQHQQDEHASAAAQQARVALYEPKAVVTQVTVGCCGTGVAAGRVARCSAGASQLPGVPPAVRL